MCNSNTPSVSAKDLFTLPLQDPEPITFEGTFTLPTGATFIVKQTLSHKAAFDRFRNACNNGGNSSPTNYSLTKPNEPISLGTFSQFSQELFNELKKSGFSTEEIINIRCSQGDLTDGLVLIEQFLSPANEADFNQYLKETGKTRAQLLETFMPAFWEKLSEVLYDARIHLPLEEGLTPTAKIWANANQKTLAQSLYNIAKRAQALFSEDFYAEQAKEALDLATSYKAAMEERYPSSTRESTERV